MAFDIIPFAAETIDRGEKTFDDFVIDWLLANGSAPI
jgi:hypothetical protein